MKDRWNCKGEDGEELLIVIDPTILEHVASPLFSVKVFVHFESIANFVETQHWKLISGNSEIKWFIDSARGNTS